MAKTQIEVKTPHDIFLDDLLVYLKHCYPGIQGLTREMLSLKPHAASAITSVNVEHDFGYANIRMDIEIVARPEV